MKIYFHSPVIFCHLPCEFCSRRYSSENFRWFRAFLVLLIPDAPRCTFPRGMHTDAVCYCWNLLILVLIVHSNIGFVFVHIPVSWSCGHSTAPCTQLSRWQMWLSIGSFKRHQPYCYRSPRRWSCSSQPTATSQPPLVSQRHLQRPAVLVLQRLAR